jgi:UPF0042 nucleotide-binding protein
LGAIVPNHPQRILLVTGMSGAGKSTALNALEDLGWEVVENLPLSLLERLLDTETAQGAPPTRPLALAIDTRTRAFDAQKIVSRIKVLRDGKHENIATLFLDCSGQELERRYSETRRRHPLALDRPTSDGIARERELLSALRRWADHVLDTSALTSNDLRLEIRTRFADPQGEAPTLTVLSFGFARGLPRNADLVFDMRFLRNPHWDKALRPLTGIDSVVGTYIAADEAYAAAVSQILSLLLLLLPRYQAEGKAYVTVAFGCTGGRHRSVFVAEYIAEQLRLAHFSPTVTHRDLGSAPLDSVEGAPKTNG